MLVVAQLCPPMPTETEVLGTIAVTRCGPGRVGVQTAPSQVPSGAIENRTSLVRFPAGLPSQSRPNAANLTGFPGRAVKPDGLMTTRVIEPGPTCSSVLALVPPISAVRRYTPVTAVV